VSVHVISWVLHQSKARLGDRLVLLMLADKANDDGTGAWPSVRTIAREARMSVRAVQYSLRRLEAAGAIVATGSSGHGTTVYTVLTTPPANSARVQSTTEIVSDFAPEPSVEPSSTSLSSNEAELCERESSELVEFNPRAFQLREMNG
jgi:hypothetical protein